MTAFGVPGVYTHDFYDGWGANYMMWVAHMRNSVGRFYETQGAGDASTRIIRSNVQRQWHRPNTPLREVVWGIRNNVNLQQSAVLIAMHEVATNREEFLHNFYTKSARSVAKAYNEGPAAYVLPADDPRSGQQVRLLQLMEDHAFEVHRADEDIEIGETVYPEGSYVVRMDQPFSRGADMLLDKQYYNPDDPRPYDDVGWTVGPLFNAKTVRVEDTAILDAEMTLLESVTVAGGVDGRRRGTYLINYNADNANLREQYDVLVMDQQRGDAMSIVRGLRGDDPIPWKATELTPNLTSVARPRPTTCAGAWGWKGCCTSSTSSRRAACLSPWQGGLQAADPLRPGRRRLHPARHLTCGPGAVSSRPVSPTTRARSATATTNWAWRSIPPRSSGRAAASSAASGGSAVAVVAARTGAPATRRTGAPAGAVPTTATSSRAGRATWGKRAWRPSARRRRKKRMTRHSEGDPQPVRRPTGCAW